MFGEGDVKMIDNEYIKLMGKQMRNFSLRYQNC